MPGSPSEAEVRAQWQNTVGVLEAGRSAVDGTLVGLMNTLEQSLEGDFMPAQGGAAVESYRSTLASMVSSARAQQFLAPVLREYGKVIRAPHTDPGRLARDLYDWFVAGGYTIKSRQITFGTPAAGGSNVGNGLLSRLTVDENGFNLEACHVETKTFKVRRDQNSGVQMHAEIMEVYGQEAGRDGIERSSRGSGLSGVTVRVRHAGTGEGGSLLRNSSFSTYDAADTPKFAGWTETSGGSNLTQDTVNYYRSHPGADVDASLKASGNFLIKQTTDEWRSAALNPLRPYFLRVMVNKTVGTAVGGNITLRLGSKSATVTVASLAAGWNELYVSLGQNAWFSEFNQNPLDAELEWDTYGSGYLLFDDMILTQFDNIDGTYYIARGGSTPFLVDDLFTVADTGGAPATAKLAWWLWVAGYGYLPSTSGAPTVTDP